MNISIYSLLDVAAGAAGTVAVIDVFRAFTTAAVALAGGAYKVIMVSAVEEALSLREKGIGDIYMGEVGGKPPPEFDFGNSPFEVCEVDFTGKSIIQRTSAGTQGNRRRRSGRAPLCGVIGDRDRDSPIDTGRLARACGARRDG